MKKFWNLMLVALVIIGAAACTENYENVEKAEGFSFYAEVVNGTRATIADENGDKTWETKWELGDKLYVNETFEFVCTDVETGKFTCYNDAVAELVGQDVTVTTDGSHHSLQGASAFYTTATVENFGEGKVALQALTSFFRYTYNGTNDVKLTLSEAAFRKADGTATNEIEVVGKTGEQFVAFWPTGNEATFSYSINGIECKSATKAFKAGMVYNMGEIVAPKVSTTWGIAGKFQNWDASNPASLYEVDNLLVAYNLTGLNGTTDPGFKFVKNKSWTGAKGASTVKVGNWTVCGTDNIKAANANDYYDVYFNPANATYCIVEAGSAAPAVPTDAVLYLIPGKWDNGYARFAAYFFETGKAETWVNLTSVGDGYYVVTAPAGYTNVIFCRMNKSATANNWNNKWQQTKDLKVPTTASVVYNTNATGEQHDKPNGSWITL